MIRSIIELAIDGATLILIVVGVVLAGTVASIPVNVLAMAIVKALQS